MQSAGGEKALAGVSDEELAARLKAGDGSVVRPLIERYRKPLHGFLTRLHHATLRDRKSCIEATPRSWASIRLSRCSREFTSPRARTIPSWSSRIA